MNNQKHPKRVVLSPVYRTAAEQRSGKIKRLLKVAKKEKALSE